MDLNIAKGEGVRNKTIGAAGPCDSVASDLRD